MTTRQSRGPVSRTRKNRSVRREALQRKAAPGIKLTFQSISRLQEGGTSVFEKRKSERKAGMKKQKEMRVREQGKKKFKLTCNHSGKSHEGTTTFGLPLLRRRRERIRNTKRKRTGLRVGLAEGRC